MKIRSVRVRIYGRVQGVWYRASTKKKAKELGVCGIVANKADGHVYAEFEAPEEKVEAMLSWCRLGPPMSKVTDIIIEEQEMVGYDTFAIVYDIL